MYSSNIVQLMNYIGFATWFSIGAAVACIPYLRWKCPDLERPIKVNLAFPVIYIVMTLVNTVFKCHFETFVGNTYFFYTTFSNFLCTGHHNTADDPAAGGDCYRARHDPVRRPRLLHIHQVDLQASFHQHLHLRGNTESPEVADGRAAFKASITTM